MTHENDTLLMTTSLSKLVSTVWEINKCQCRSKFFSVAKIAELLRSPQRHSRVTIQNQEMIVEKKCF